MGERENPTYMLLNSAAVAPSASEAMLGLKTHQVGKVEQSSDQHP